MTQEVGGGFVAECLTEGIVTQANDWDMLRQNVREAVAAFYFDRTVKTRTHPLRVSAESVIP